MSDTAKALRSLTSAIAPSKKPSPRKEDEEPADSDMGSDDEAEDQEEEEALKAAGLRKDARRPLYYFVSQVLSHPLDCAPVPTGIEDQIKVN